MNAKPLRDVDTASRMLLLQLMLWMFAVLVAVEFVVHLTQWWVIVLVDPLVAYAAGWAQRWVITRIGYGANALLAPAGVPFTRTYSEQDALIARGQLREAADSFRSYLVAFPDDRAARLRLAALLAEDPQQATAAEQVFLDIRRREPSRAEEWIICNGLIDLYRRSGDRWKLQAEVERLVHRYGATDAGRSAAAFLRELENETPRSLPLSE